MGMQYLIDNGFPVLGAPEGCADTIDVTKLDNDHAIDVHSQSLVRLAQRGGLCPTEIKINIDRGTWGDGYGYDAQECIDLVNSIAFVPTTLQEIE